MRQHIIFYLLDWVSLLTSSSINESIELSKNANSKACLHRRFLSRQLKAIFVALKLELQNRTCKPGAIFCAISRPILQGFEHVWNLLQFLRHKNRLCKRAFRPLLDLWLLERRFSPASFRDSRLPLVNEYTQQLSGEKIYKVNFIKH